MFVDDDILLPDQAIKLRNSLNASFVLLAQFN